MHSAFTFLRALPLENLGPAPIPIMKSMANLPVDAGLGPYHRTLSLLGQSYVISFKVLAVLTNVFCCKDKAIFYYVRNSLYYHESCL